MLGNTNSSHVLSTEGPADVSGASSPATRGELAIVVPHSGMQLAALTEKFTALPCRAQYGPIAVPSVCPTCKRPLHDTPMEGGPPSMKEPRLTPQYFRALVKTNAQHLSICGSPSARGQQEKEDASASPRQLRMSAASSRSGGKRKDNVCNEEEEDGTECEVPSRKEADVCKPRNEEVCEDVDNVSVGSNNNNAGYYQRYFREIQKLGNGTFGGVYLCQHVMEGVALGYFALKKIPVGDNVEYFQKVLREVRILEEVKRHPNVVEYSHSWVDIAQVADFGPPVRCLFILMEYATMGSLDSYLERRGKALPTVAVWYLFLSALMGISHLHQKNILHRDLKPQNLLLTGSPEKPPRVLVSDFGTATLLSELSYERTGGTGTMEYMAPELFVCTPGSDGVYVHPHTKATDIWSLGMILHYLACNGTLPDHLPNGELLLNVERASSYERPPEMIELIRAMLQYNPKKRPTCKELLKSTVVQTIMRSFEKARHSNDIFPTGVAVAAETDADLSTSSLRRSMDASKRSIRVETQSCESSASQLRDWRSVNPYDNEESTTIPHSPVVEVPLMLQYTTKELRRNTVGGARGANRNRRSTTVDQAVQTDFVKIIYE